MIKEKKKDWEYTPEGIDYGLDTSRDFLSDDGRYWISESLAYLPENVIDFIVKNIIFIDVINC